MTRHRLSPLPPCSGRSRRRHKIAAPRSRPDADITAKRCINSLPPGQRVLHPSQRAAPKINHPASARPHSCSPPHAHAPTGPPAQTASRHCPNSTLPRHGPLGHRRRPLDRTAHGATTLTSGNFASEHHSRTPPGPGSPFTTLAGLRRPSRSIYPQAVALGNTGKYL